MTKKRTQLELEALDFHKNPKPGKVGMHAIKNLFEC